MAEYLHPLGLTFRSRKASPSRPVEEDSRFLIDVTRTSDDRVLPRQMWFDHDPSFEEVMKAADYWIAERVGAIAPEPTPCHVCKTHLEPDFMDTDYQFENALWVTFDGGYGMFVDPVEYCLDKTKDHPYRVVICHDCAHDLCEQVPWIKALLNPSQSHGHKLEYQNRDPDHVGWDMNDD